MHNRITTLFELDGLVAPKAGATRGSAPSRSAPSASRPAKRAGGTAKPATTKSMAFDNGAPIVCEHNRPAAPSFAQSLPPVMDPRAAYPFRVESFESDDESLLGTEEQPDPERDPTELYAHDDEPTAGEDEDSSIGDIAEEEEEDEELEPSIGAQAESLAVRDPAYAAQLAAVERDLKDLAIRTQHPTPEEERASVLGGATSDDATASAPSPRSMGGHEVFDRMAAGMQYANTFALPSVVVRRSFDEMNRQLDAQQRRAAAGALATTTDEREAVLSAAKRRAGTLAISAEELARDVASLTPPPLEPAEPAERVARRERSVAQAAPHLKYFPPADLILSAAEAGRVIEWFWPDVKASQLGGITDRDRSFAQALLVEALDASADMKIVEDIYKETYMKVFKDFDDVWEVVKTLAKRAYEDEWFTRAKGRITRDNVENLTIYDSVKKTLARNFRSEIKIRVATGEYVGY
jgi:hypothetical protein